MLLHIDKVHPRGVLMMLILLLQVTTFVQSSLLLRCGDIESNPGPGIYPGKVYYYYNTELYTLYLIML